MMPSATELNANDLLTSEQIDRLRRISSPTIANAIETFDLRPRTEGVSSAGVQCLFPEMGALVGYACTALIKSAQPPAAKRNVSRTAYWEYTRNMPSPKVTVVQDLSDTPGGAYWGEVNATMHLALGSSGVITNGSVRDLDEVRATGFQFFASGISVSHGFAHLEEFGCPVTVFGMTVKSGDLVHADRHGVVVIPGPIAGLVAAVAAEIEQDEKVILSLCKSPKFSIAELDQLISPNY